MTLVKTRFMALQTAECPGIARGLIADLGQNQRRSLIAGAGKETPEKRAPGNAVKNHRNPAMFSATGIDRFKENILATRTEVLFGRLAPIPAPQKSRGNAIRRLAASFHISAAILPAGMSAVFFFKARATRPQA